MDYLVSCMYAPYRDSLAQFFDLVECVGNGDSEIDAENYPNFLSAASAAVELLFSRPRSVPIPEFDVRANGKVEFEWYQSPNKLIATDPSVDRGTNLAH